MLIKMKEEERTLKMERKRLKELKRKQQEKTGPDYMTQISSGFKAKPAHAAKSERKRIHLQPTSTVHGDAWQRVSDKAPGHKRNRKMSTIKEGGQYFGDGGDRGEVGALHHLSSGEEEKEVDGQSIRLEQESDTPHTGVTLSRREREILRQIRARDKMAAIARDPTKEVDISSLTWDEDRARLDLKAGRFSNEEKKILMESVERYVWFCGPCSLILRIIEHPYLSLYFQEILTAGCVLLLPPLSFNTRLAMSKGFSSTDYSWIFDNPKRKKYGYMREICKVCVYCLDDSICV